MINFKLFYLIVFKVIVTGGLAIFIFGGLNEKTIGYCMLLHLVLFFLSLTKSERQRFEKFFK